MNNLAGLTKIEKLPPTVQIDPETGYFTNIEDIRISEYPSLTDTTYLDHAGTTLYAKSLIETYSNDLIQNLYGNPHSASASSQLSSNRIDDVRIQVLRFFNASPDEFDVVFTANATAAIKLVAEAFRDSEAGFWYSYHVDSHTSLVGVREVAKRGSQCLTTGDMETLLSSYHESVVDQQQLSLLAYPGQSNMTGQKLPLKWCETVKKLRRSGHRQIYTLLDAAALASTSPIDLSNAATAPDFVALSFYKIFGFPDLGALIIHNEAGDILQDRRYFGGGTIDMVATSGDTWYAKKEKSLHSQLEDGTVPFHSVIALRHALRIYSQLYGSMANISKHTNYLALRLRRAMADLHHSNGTSVCQIHSPSVSPQGALDHGATIAFNLRDATGNYVSINEVEKLATVKGIQFRTGGLCNPGGTATHLGLSADDMRQNYDAGHRCGSENDIVNGKPTGTIRVSFGAMSSIVDVKSLLDFLDEFYVDKLPIKLEKQTRPGFRVLSRESRFVVESLSVFPIKSCGAFKVPPNVSWEVGPKGLAWDREWCLVHEGTLTALSQKRYPRMALLQPSINLSLRKLYITHDIQGSGACQLSVSLDDEHIQSKLVTTCESVTNRLTSICGESLNVEHYTAPHISQFFTDALGVPCTLARFPRNGKIRQAQVRVPLSDRLNDALPMGKSISLANESPILLVSRSSVNRLNEHIKANGSVGKAVTADSFRGNIVVQEELEGGESESPYVEDQWTELKVGDTNSVQFEVLGPCQRCQMVCVDQKNAQRRQEPFSTLAKTRRKDGKVWFGMHLCLTNPDDRAVSTNNYIAIGDKVVGYS